VIALARGLASIIEAPSRVFEALPAVEASEAPREAPPPPTTPDAKRTAPKPPPSKREDAAPSPPAQNRTKPDGLRRRTMRGAPSEEELARLAADIEAHAKGEEGKGNRGAVMALATAAKLSGRSHLYGFLRDRREGKGGTIGPAMYRALRAALDATTTPSTSEDSRA
jgi:hypothetical protein